MVGGGVPNQRLRLILEIMVAQWISTYTLVVNPPTSHGVQLLALTFLRSTSQGVEARYAPLLGHARMEKLVPGFSVLRLSVQIIVNKC